LNKSLDYSSNDKNNLEEATRRSSYAYNSFNDYCLNKTEKNKNRQNLNLKLINSNDSNKDNNDSYDYFNSISELKTNNKALVVEKEEGSFVDKSNENHNAIINAAENLKKEVIKQFNDSVTIPEEEKVNKNHIGNHAVIEKEENKEEGEKNEKQVVLFINNDASIIDKNVKIENGENKAADSILIKSEKDENEDNDNSLKMFYYSPVQVENYNEPGNEEKIHTPEIRLQESNSQIININLNADVIL